MDLNCKTCRWFIGSARFSRRDERGFTYFYNSPACMSGNCLSPIPDDPEKHVCGLWIPHEIIPSDEWWNMHPLERLKRAGVEIKENKNTAIEYLKLTLAITCPKCMTALLRIADVIDDKVYIECQKCKRLFLIGGE